MALDTCSASNKSPPSVLPLRGARTVRVTVELGVSELQELKARFEELCREPAPPFGEMFDEPTRRKMGVYIGRLVSVREHRPPKS
jgi:hypothetical protein